MRKGVELDAIKASQLLYEDWGIRIDWHEMSDALEYLVRSKEACRTETGPYGLPMYLIN